MVKIPEPVKIQSDINKIVSNIIQLNQIECKKRNIQIEQHLSKTDFYAQIDPIQFDQAIINVIKNAYEALEENGVISIVTDAENRKIVIKNNGPELSEAVKEKLFTPFFTTKRQGQGIGLMFIREVLLNHQCYFDFYSKDGWTIFEIYC